MGKLLDGPVVYRKKQDKISKPLLFACISFWMSVGVWKRTKLYGQPRVSALDKSISRQETPVALCKLN